MKYKLQIEKLKQLKMESVNKYCIMKQSMKAKEILKQAELKKSDFINEAVYNTVVGNICKLLTKIDELDECVNFQKNCKHEDTRAYYYRDGEYALKICDKCNAHLD